MAEGYVSTAKVAEYLNVSEDTIERLRRKRAFNSFPCHKVGSQWRYKLSEIELWVHRETLAGNKVVRKERAQCLSMVVK